jgi:hypothetical protein
MEALTRGFNWNVSKAQTSLQNAVVIEIFNIPQYLGTVLYDISFVINKLYYGL